MDLHSKVNTFANRGKLGSALAAHISQLAARAAAVKGRFWIALSGGSLIDIISPVLASKPWRERIDWSSWHVFWVDERWVPWSSSDSNYGQFRRKFLHRVKIPEEQIHATDDSLAPARTAAAYANVLADVLTPRAGQVPRFDLILLGLGADGHTASLFPRHPALHEDQRWVVPVFDAPKPPPIRISMTLPVINHARHVIFVAAGSSKATIVATLLQSDVGGTQLPARRVNPMDGTLQWFMDQAAAGLQL